MNKRLLFVCLMTLVSASLVAQNKQITMEDLWLNNTFNSQAPYYQPSPNNGEIYYLLQSDGLHKYDFRTGDDQGLAMKFDPSWELSSKDVISYTWDADEQQLLLMANRHYIYRRSYVADYYLYNTANGTFRKLTTGGKASLAQFSPDGQWLAYVRNNNLFTLNLNNMVETAVTDDGEPGHIINGTTDWVYEEEFAITKGFQWSPDSRRIAFYRFDESRVKEFTLQMWDSLYPTPYTYKYPKAGEENSIVDICVYTLSNKRIYTPRLGSEKDQYLPRFQWINSDLLGVMRLNRLQNHLELLSVNTLSGIVNTLYDEQSSTYVDVPEVCYFCRNGKQFIISTEKEGYRHVYIYNFDGTMVRDLTPGDFDVERVVKIDEPHGVIYYLAHESSPINVEFFASSLDGKHHKRMAEANGTYDITFSAQCHYYIQQYVTANSVPVYTLHDTKGNLIRTLEDNAKLSEVWKDYNIGHKTFGTFTTEQGIELNYYQILPPDFNQYHQYPLLFFVYGGPGSQQVLNTCDNRDYYWFHALAQKGFVVVCFDGRGTGGRGTDFKKCTYRDMGHLECNDAIEAARYFGRQSYIDAEKIGIFGWSFGGYLSSLALFKGNDVFRCAIAVAPVTNWRFYDNIYTERFLQRPQDNPDGYDQNSPLTFANQLKGKYLLVHGTADDNVHVQNSMALAKALEDAGKQFELRIYPDLNHSLPTRKARYNLYTLMTDFLERELK